MYQFTRLFDGLVPNTDGDGDSVQTVSPQSEMTPDETGVPKPTDGGQSSVDWQQEKQTLIDKYERDISQLKSTLQSNAATTENRLKDQIGQLTSQVNELTMRSLPEEQRPAFKKQLEEQQIQRIAQENQTLRQQLDQQGQAMQYINYYKQNFGIDMSELDLSQGVSSIYASGQRLIKERFDALNGKSTTPEPQSMQQPMATQAPQVASNTQGIPPQAPSVSRIVRDDYGGNEENYWRDVEMGRRPPPV